jgi:hypothetical protein
MALVVRETGLRATAYNQPTYAVPINLSNDGGNVTKPGNATSPAIATSGLNLYVAWSEFSNGILFRMSPDGGTTWYPPVNDTGYKIPVLEGGRATGPVISANGSNVYVAWSQTIGTSGAQILEATSTNGGTSFATAVQVSSGSGPYVTPAIASWGSDIALVYTASNKSYVSVSNDSGSTWSAGHLFADNHEPAVAMWGSYIYAIADPVTLAVSDNLGANWTVTTPTPGGDTPSIAAYGSNVYAAWESKGSDSQVYVMTSNNYGSNTTVRDLSSGVSNSWDPVVGAHGSSAWVALHTTPGGDLSRVYSFTTNNNGSSWGSPASLSGPLGNDTNTSYPFGVESTDGTNVFAAWSQQVSTNYWRLMVSYSGDGGTTWSPAPGIDVSQNPNGTEASNANAIATGAIASSGASSFAVWQYSNDSIPGGNQIYFTAYVAPINSTTTRTTTGGTPTTTLTNVTTSMTTSGTITSSSFTSIMASTHSTTSGITSSTKASSSSNSGLILDAGIAAVVVIVAAIVAAFVLRRR